MTHHREAMNLNEKAAEIADTRDADNNKEYFLDLQERWRAAFIRKNLRKGEKPKLIPFDEKSG